MKRQKVVLFACPRCDSRIRTVENVFALETSQRCTTCLRTQGVLDGLTVVMTAAPADTVKVMSHLMLLLYSFGFSNSWMSVKRPSSPRLFPTGTTVGVADVEVSDAGDLSPVFGAEALLREVEEVAGQAVAISSVGASGRASSLDTVSMSSCRIVKGNWRWAREQEEKLEMRLANMYSRGIVSTDLGAQSSRRPRFCSFTDLCAAGPWII